MHKIEPAPTGRAACRGCKQSIAKGELRFAEEFQSPYAGEGGPSFRYWHVTCAARKLANEVGAALKSYDGPVDDRDSMEALVREHVRPEIPYAEHAANGRARCRACDAAIKKGEMRIAFERVYESPMGPQKGAAYAHPKCLSRYLEREREHGRESSSRDEVAQRVLANSKLPQGDLDVVRRDMTS
jgi:poly [ADP-ribose] polymerase